MTDLVRRWLPTGTFDVAVCGKAISEAISEWSNIWFAEADIGFVREEADPAACLDMEKSNFMNIDAGGSLVTSEDERRTIAAELLGVDFDKLSPLPADRQPVEKLVDESIEDLCQRFARTFEHGETVVEKTPEHSNDDFCGRLEDRKRRVFGRVRIPLEALILKFISRFTETGGEKPVRSRWSAVHGSELLTGVGIGECKLSLAELSELQTGDVIKLDRRLDKQLDLTITGKVACKNALILDRKNRGFNATLKF